MMKFNAEFTEEQLACIEAIKTAFKEDNDYMADAGVVTSWFACDVCLDDDCDEYCFRKISEFAIGEHTVISKIIVEGDDYNSTDIGYFIMFTKSKVDSLDKKWMNFHDIKPIAFRTYDVTDAVEWKLKRDIWDELDWHKENSFLGREVMEADLKFLGYQI